MALDNTFISCTSVSEPKNFSVLLNQPLEKFPEPYKDEKP